MSHGHVSNEINPVLHFNAKTQVRLRFSQGLRCLRAEQLNNALCRQWDSANAQDDATLRYCQSFGKKYLSSHTWKWNVFPIVNSNDRHRPSGLRLVKRDLWAYVNRSRTGWVSVKLHISLYSPLVYYTVRSRVSRYPISILYKSIAGRYRPIRVADGPITARYRFMKNASWTVQVQISLRFCAVCSGPALSALPQDTFSRGVAIRTVSLTAIYVCCIVFDIRNEFLRSFHLWFHWEERVYKAEKFWCLSLHLRTLQKRLWFY